MTDLASILSYYIGEHGGEYLDCIIMRKGKSMIPYLERARLRSECLEK